MNTMLRSRIRTIKLTIILNLFLAYLGPTFSQNPIDKINIPTSPEAALIGRFGDIPIGYYTGTANISIPLYTIKESGVEIPITLSYHSSGIKVEDQATWVGLGWDLSPEGSIIQEVRGKNDEEDYGNYCPGNNFYTQFLQRIDAFFYINDLIYYGYLTQMGRVSAPPNSCEGGILFYPYYNNTEGDPTCAIDKLQRGLGKPDIYSYSFCGYSGKFYINPETRQPILIDRQEQIFFEKTTDDNITAITLDGTIFNFGAVEKAHGGAVYEYTGKTYKINKISFLNGRKILFDYSDNSYADRILNEMAYINYMGTTNPYPVLKFYTGSYQLKKTLTKITTQNEIIDFNQESRDDINANNTDNLKRLKSIDITSKVSLKKIKTLEFVYSYFPYNFVGAYDDPYTPAHPEALGKRLKLDALKEIGYNDGVPVDVKPPYQFEYDLSVTMPIKHSFAKDFWGYYNGEDNSTLLPDLDYFDYQYDPLYQITEPNQTTTIKRFNYPYTGANRYTDNSKAGAYLLNKITYPTGGSTEFEYEPNTFSNQFIPDHTKPVYKHYYITDEPANTNNTIQPFKLSKSTSIHFINKINNYAHGYSQLTRDNMLGSYIKLFKAKYVSGVLELIYPPVYTWNLDGVTNNEFEINFGVTWDEYIRVEFDPDPEIYYCVEVDFPQVAAYPTYYGIGVNSAFSYNDDTDVDVSESQQCGMRVKTIKNYSKPGTLVSDKLVKYYDGKLLNRFQPLNVYKASCKTSSGVNGGEFYEYIGFYKKITVSGNDFGTNGGNPIGYGKVEVIELFDGNLDWGKTVYYYNNELNETHQGCPNVPNLRNGLISKEEIHDNMNNTLKEKIYNYDYLSCPSPYKCINLVQISTGPEIPCGNSYLPTPYTTQFYNNNGKEYDASKYGYDVYIINCEWNKLESITTNQFFNNIAFTSKESYTYNSEGNIRTAITKNSKNETLTSKYYYPLDKMVNSEVEQHMIDLHNTGTPVMIEQYNETTLISRQKTEYSSFPSAPTFLPHHIYTKNGNSPEELKLTVKSYDEAGKITEYAAESNISNSYQYSYNNLYPISETKNATIPECSYTGFENHETSGWSLYNYQMTDDPLNIKTGKTAAIYTSYPIWKTFSIWNADNTHSGFKASAWVKGSNSAYIKIMIEGNSSIYRQTNNEGGDPSTWKLIEVELPYSFYKNIYNSDTKLTVQCGSSSTAYFDDIRFYPLDAQMTNYTYSPLIGVTSVSDINNKPTTYEYDGLGRLSIVRDFLGDILKKYDYHYKP